MIPTSRVKTFLSELKTHRPKQLLAIFSEVASRKSNINVNMISRSSSIIFAISDGKETGTNFKDWRFRTITDGLNALYFEIWTNVEKDQYCLDRSYFHLYTFKQEDETEIEYILLHCDASEPDETPHSFYKQSPHLHIKVASHPIPKAHFALYNGRLKEIFKNVTSFDVALKESITMIKSQILQQH